MGKRLVAKVVLYLLLCGGCGVAFAICESCYRGQSHCGRACRRRTRRENHRAANALHQTGFDGRLDHARRQAEYREREAGAQEVTDQGSPDGVVLSTVPTSPVSAEEAAAIAASRFNDEGWFVCVVCGRPRGAPDRQQHFLTQPLGP